MRLCGVKAEGGARSFLRPPRVRVPSLNFATFRHAPPHDEHGRPRNHGAEEPGVRADRVDEPVERPPEHPRLEHVDQVFGRDEPERDHDARFVTAEDFAEHAVRAVRRATKTRQR